MQKGTAADGMNLPVWQSWKRPSPVLNQIGVPGGTSFCCLGAKPMQALARKDDSRLPSLSPGAPTIVDWLELLFPESEPLLGADAELVLCSTACCCSVSLELANANNAGV